MAGGHLGQAALGQAVGRELGADVALALARRAGVGEQDLEHVGHHRAAGREAHRRDHEPLLQQLARAGGHAARRHAAHVGVVGPGDGVGGDRPVEGQRRDHREVGQVGAAAVGVVHQPDLAGRGAALAGRVDRLGHRAQVHRDRGRLHHHAALGVEDRRAAVAPLLDVRAEGAAHERRLHLLGHGAQGVGHHLEGDRVHGGHAPSSRSSQQAADGVGAGGPALGDPAGGAVHRDHRRPRHRRAQGPLGQPGVGAGPLGRQAQRDGLDRPPRLGVAVARRVGVVEGRRQLALGRRRVPVDRERVALADVAAVGRGAQRGARDLRAGAIGERLQQRGQVVAGVDPGQDRLHVVAPLAGHDEPEGGEHARGRRRDHPPHPELVRHRAGVQRPRAAEGDQGRLARVLAALDAHQPQGADHLLDGHLEDALGARLDLHPQLGGEAGDGGPGGIGVEGDAAAQGRVGRQAAEHDVGVGDRRAVPAQAVGGGAGAGARRLGADAQGPARVGPGDAAAAGRDRGDVEHRQVQRVAGDDGLAGAGRGPVADQGDVARGAAHVEGQRQRGALARRQPGGADDAAGRPAEDGPGGVLGGGLDRQHAAARLHDRGRRQAGLGRALAQAAQVGAQDGREVGVHRRRREALVLPDLGQHLARRAHVDAGQGRAQRVGHLALVVRVGEREQQPHRHGLALGRRGRPRRRAPARRRRAARARRRARSAPAPRGCARAGSAGAGGRRRGGRARRASDGAAPAGRRSPRWPPGRCARRCPRAGRSCRRSCRGRSAPRRRGRAPRRRAPRAPPRRRPRSGRPSWWGPWRSPAGPRPRRPRR